MRPVLSSIHTSFAYGLRYKNGTVHKGIDYSNGTEGSGVYACLTGVVTHVGYGGWGPAYGQHVIIRSVFGGKNVWIIYAHLKTEHVSYGQTITAGKKIGTIGGAKGKKYSGNSTGPHVHVQLGTANNYLAYTNPIKAIEWQPKAPVTPSIDKMDPKSYGPGKVGPAVTWLGERMVRHLNALHIDPPYAEGPGPTWGTADTKAVILFQQARNWTAKAPGLPDKTFLTEIAKEPIIKKPAAGLDVTTISFNIAGYDSAGKGEKTAVARSKQIPEHFKDSNPLWYHFQEASTEMLSGLDKGFSDYKRISQGGKGRESYYRKGQGITILEAKLVNVKHMLRRDSKEMLVIAWEKDGFKGVEVNFHSENEGTKVQPLQLRDAMTEGRDMADKHKIKRANILVTGDANFGGAALFAKSVGWSEVTYRALVKSKLGYSSLNGWKAGVRAGKRLDVDVVQKSAVILKAEQLTGKVLSDHWAHRVKRRLLR